MSDHRKCTINRSGAGLLILSILLLLIGLLPACRAATSQQLKVVTTSNIVADWMRQVGGERVDVFALLPAGTDPHTFQPGAADVALVAQADIIFTVGSGLEGIWMSRLLKNAAAEPGRVVALIDYVDPIIAEEEREEKEEEEEHGPFDPHFWWDPLRVKKAIDEITQRLTAVDTAGAETYSRNSFSYQKEVDRLHNRIIERTNQIPTGRRKLVSSHETMNYFAEQYGFVPVGAVFPGISTEREPSPAELTELVRKIREFNVPAIFTETIVSERLSRTVANETGVKIVRLYSDSLGTAGSGAETYIKMMDVNVQAIVEALK